MKRQNNKIGIRVLFLLLVCLFACSACTREAKKSNTKKKESLTLWYSQSSMKDYLEHAAKAYQEKYQVTVTCVYKESKQYMEELYQASMNEEQETPDLYLLRNDKLGRVYMEGLTAANSAEVYNQKNYCDTALQAAEYKGTRVAYPLYYNTVCMMYNTEYFQPPPSTMGAITAFSETAEIGENIQYIFYWNLNDYFCNFPFVGNYLEIGGSSGDDRNTLSILNEQTLACMQQFQQLGQYFAIDSETIQKEDIPAALMEGRTLCILADSDMVHTVNWYEVQNGIKVPYHICAIPDISEELKSCAGSYTELVLVNGMSLKQEQAAKFAQFLTYDYVDVLYDLAGHFPAKRGVNYQNQELSELYPIYEQSKPFPKLLETEDLNVNLEVLFANVWKGADIGTELQKFTDKMELRMHK